MDYLNSWSNLRIEDQRFIFSIRSEMNPIKSNFRRNNKMEAEFCIEKCGKELDNEHLTWCQYLNKENDFKYSDILNGDLQQKVYTFKQIQRNQELRRAERTELLLVTL